MDTGLEFFIKSSYTPDKADLLLETLGLLDLAAVTGYANKFYEIMMEQGNVDASETASAFESHAYNTLCVVLKEHGIELNEGAGLMELNQFTDGILNLPYYTGIEDVLRFTECDFTSEEKLVNILMLVTPMEESRALMSIEKINPGIIGKISDIFNLKQEINSEELIQKEISNKCTRKFRDVVRYLKFNGTLAQKLVDAGVYIGAELEEYLPYISHKLDDITYPEQLGAEIFALLAMTKDGVDNPQECFSKHADHLFGSITTISFLSNQLNYHAVKFEQYLQSRRLLIKEENNG